MRIPQKTTKNLAKKYLSLPDLFPKSKIDLRKNLTPYQERKINNALKSFPFLGITEKNHVEIKKGRKEFLKSENLPAWLKVVPLVGGKHITHAEYTNGELTYKKGRSKRTVVKFSPSDYKNDNELAAAVLKILKRKSRKGRNAKLMINGGAVGGWAEGTDDDEDGNEFFIEMLFDFLYKYVQLFSKGKKRREKGKKIRLINPTVWQFAVLFEG